MTEVKQADPMSLLLPLGEYATEPDDRHLCLWINEKGENVGEQCGRVCNLKSNEYCSAHLNLAKKREVYKYQTPDNTPYVANVRETGNIEDLRQRKQMAERYEIPIEAVLSPQEIQANVESLKKLELLNNMMELLKISFK